MLLIYARDVYGTVGDPHSTIGLPWRCRRDMIHFMRHTAGRPVLMGHRTFSLIGQLRDKTFVDTRDGVHVVKDGELVPYSRSLPADTVLVGGPATYDKYFAKVDTILETVFHADLRVPDAVTWQPSEQALSSFELVGPVRGAMMPVSQRLQTSPVWGEFRRLERIW